LQTLLTRPLPEKGRRGRPSKAKEQVTRKGVQVSLHDVIDTLLIAQSESSRLMGVFLAFEPLLQKNLILKSNFSNMTLLRCAFQVCEMQVALLLGAKELASYAGISTVPWALHGRSLRGRPLSEEKQDTELPFVERAKIFWSTIDKASYTLNPELFTQDPNIVQKRITGFQNYLIASKGKVGKKEVFNVENPDSLNLLTPKEAFQLLEKVALHDTGVKAQPLWENAQEFLELRAQNS
jgi:hypothetical protein